MAQTPVQNGQLTMYKNISGAAETDNAAHTSQVETVVSGTAFQISQTQGAHLYIGISTSAAIAVAIGPTNACAIAVLPSVAEGVGLTSVYVPAGWFVKITGTVADFTATAVLEAAV